MGDLASRLGSRACWLGDRSTAKPIGRPAPPCSCSYSTIEEWTKGTWLQPVLDAMGEPEAGAFEASHAEIVQGDYPRHADGRTLLPFRRLVIVARARA
jgi:hypothetical protein